MTALRLALLDIEAAQEHLPGPVHLLFADAGARLSTLRGVVALEGAVPLLTVAVVAIGTGFGAAAMYATEAQNRPMAAPGLAYYLLTVSGIIVSLAIIAATFPILTRITGPEVARND